MKRKIFFVALLCTFSLSACGGGNTSTTETPTESSVEESTAEDSSVSADNDSDGWGKCTSVRTLIISNHAFLFYQDYQTAWESSPEDPIAKRDYEAQLMKRLQKNMVFQQMMLLTYICMYWETTIK